MMEMLVIAAVLMLVNGIFTLLGLKIYTEYVKDRLLRRRRSGQKEEGQA